MVNGGSEGLAAGSSPALVCAFSLSVDMAKRNAAVAVAAVALAMGCSSPTRPGDPVVLRRLTVTGPTSVQPGQVLRYTAMAEYSDGTSRDVTAHSEWSPRPPIPGVIQFTQPGVANSTSAGEQTITAKYEEFSAPTKSETFTAELTVLSLQPGTFKVSGRIGEAGTSAYLFDVTVRVVSGMGTELHASMGNGRYSFYGLAGPVRLEASAPDHETQTRDLTVTGNIDTQDFFLVTTQKFEDVSGPWTFALVGPSSGCAAGFPAAARDRQYALQITQQNTHLTMDLRRATLFVETPEIFFGTVSGTHVLLDFPPLQDITGTTRPNLIDRLSPTETLSFWGRVIGDLAGAEINATLTGSIQYWTGPTTQPPAWECTAANHEITIRR
jgi:hypothetical protein